MTQSFPITDELVEKLKKDAVKADRLKLFSLTISQFKTLYAALTGLPYKDAQPAIAELNEVQAIIGDPLGDFQGVCLFCEDPVFITGCPEDDAESHDDGWAHRTCTDKMREEHPEMFHATDSADD